MNESTDPVSIQSLSETAVMLEEARKVAIKAYSAWRVAKETEDSLRFQLQADLARYGADNTVRGETPTEAQIRNSKEYMKENK